MEELGDRLVRFILYFKVMWPGDLCSAVSEIDHDGYDLPKMNSGAHMTRCRNLSVESEVCFNETDQEDFNSG